MLYRITILFCALLMISGVGSVEAARPSAYARAKMHNRIYTHRPSYKLYKGRKSHKKGLFHFGSSGRGKVKHTPKRSSRI